MHSLGPAAFALVLAVCRVALADATPEPPGNLPPPIVVDAQQAVVTLETTAPAFTGTDRRLARFSFPQTDMPVLAETLDRNGHRLLKELYSAGKAAGNHGDLYDNRDRAHSRLRPANHPQLTHVAYDNGSRQAELDYGLGDRMLFDAPTLGNSSTALTNGPFWRSLPRMALTGGDGSGPLRLFQNYLAGHIYIYPEHRDHDPEHGDLMPANTPYLLISQGSSRSDRAHLEAIAMILAALRPDTKEFLRDKGLLASTIQMIFRRSQNTVLSREAYLSGLAHPSVFPARVINTARMVALANAITPQDAPPMIQMTVESEDLGIEGLDYFGAGLRERFFDTPSAIGRIWRSRRYSRSTIISVADTRDPNGRELEFTWSVLRGDPEKTRVELLDPEGTRARISIDWQDPRPIPGMGEIHSNRVDIGVFANNGVHDSAPGFFSVVLPHHEMRTYGEGPDGMWRIENIDYAYPDNVYVDPALYPRIDWKDEYIYDASGELRGWIRNRNNVVTEYDADGARILDRDGNGKPSHLEKVEYISVPTRTGTTQIAEVLSRDPGSARPARNNMAPSNDRLSKENKGEQN